MGSGVSGGEWRSGTAGAIIDPHYHTPYAIHATAGVQHAFNDHWVLGADYTHETGMHGYRAYPFSYPRRCSSRTIAAAYDALMIHFQGNTHRVQPDRQLHAFEREDLGLRAGRVV